MREVVIALIKWCVLYLTNQDLEGVSKEGGLFHMRKIQKGCSPIKWYFSYTQFWAEHGKKTGLETDNNYVPRLELQRAPFTVCKCVSDLL